MYRSRDRQGSCLYLNPFIVFYDTASDVVCFLSIYYSHYTVRSTNYVSLHGHWASYSIVSVNFQGIVI